MPQKVTQVLGGVTALAIIVAVVSVVWAASQAGGKLPQPIVKFDIKDPKEVTQDAELYLAVESSRAPGKQVVYPLNVGETERWRGYIELPFMVETGDRLVFTLMDCDKISDEQIAKIKEATAKIKFMVIVDGTFRLLPSNPVIEAKVKSRIQVEDWDEMLADSIELALAKRAFEDYGGYTYHVGRSMPTTDAEANELVVLGESEVLRRMIHRMSLWVFEPSEDGNAD